MPVGQQTKYWKSSFAIFGCFAIWLLYTLIFRQIILFDTNYAPEKKLDSKQEMYEIDQRVSVCFKDIAPSSILLKQDANVCQNIHDLLIVVHSDPTNFQLRAEFRKTLRQVKKEATIHDLKIDSVFMLGLDKDQCVSSALLQEISLEKDILISSFIDSSENQTLKSVNTLKWFHENCLKSKLLLKLDSRMDPSTSFSTRQFYKSIKSWRNENTILLGSRSLPKVFLGNISHSTTTSLYPISAQYLHLNYLLSRNVVIALLKARADAINISAWNEDLFVTGVLANVAQIRPNHDERFLRQCAGTLCTFCECSILDSERQIIDFRRPYYLAHNFNHVEESAQSTGGLIILTDSTGSTLQYESTSGTDYTPSTYINGAEIYVSSTEQSTLTSSTLSFAEVTTMAQNELTEHFKSIAEITTTESTPTIENTRDTEIFFRGKAYVTTGISSPFAEISSTTKEGFFSPMESKNFMVTVTNHNENMHSSTVNQLTSTSKLDRTRKSSSHFQENSIDKVTEKFEISLSRNDSKEDKKKVEFVRTAILGQRVKLRISSSTSKSETFQLKSAPSLSSGIQVRVTSSASTTTKGKEKADHRTNKLRQKRKMKKIMIRVRRMFLKLPTTKTRDVLKNPK